MGFSTLPNEILFQIVDLAHVDKQTWIDVLNMRLVDQHLNHLLMLHLLGNEVHMAAMRGNIDALRYLSRTEDLELPGRSFKSALHAAAAGGCEDTVAWLLLQGAKINHIQGIPLQAAVERGHHGVVSLLLEAGADANLPFGEYGGILVTAVFLERLAIVELLSKKYPCLLRQRSALGSPLDVASCRKDGNTEMLLALIRAGADVVQNNPEDGSPIVGAVICGYQKNVRTLLEFGAPCEQALKVAIQKKRHDIASEILSHDSDSLRRVTTDRWSPMTCAARNDDFPMVLLILKCILRGPRLGEA